MTQPVFTKAFTQQEPIPEPGIARVVELMRQGRSHRYNLDKNDPNDTSQLEEAFAAWQGADYCLACTSGGYLIQLALRVCEQKQGDLVLANAYTLAPVLYAIHAVGGVPVLVDIDDNYHIDLDDLESKAASSQASFLLLSHMRGHIADMDQVTEICQSIGLPINIRPTRWGRNGVANDRVTRHSCRLFYPNLQTYELW